jgi:hypothetical protein
MAKLCRTACHDTPWLRRSSSEAPQLTKPKNPIFSCSVVAEHAKEMLGDGIWRNCVTQRAVTRHDGENDAHSLSNHKTKTPTKNLSSFRVVAFKGNA